MTFRTLVESLIAFFNTTVIPLLVFTTLLFFLWGVVNYFFLNQNDPKKRAEGVQFMLWGVIGLTVIVSMWGLVRILLNTFGL